MLLFGRTQHVGILTFFILIFSEYRNQILCYYLVEISILVYQRQYKWVIGKYCLNVYRISSVFCLNMSEHIVMVHRQVLSGNIIELR